MIMNENIITVVLPVNVYSTKLLVLTDELTRYLESNFTNFEIVFVQYGNILVADSLNDVIVNYKSARLIVLNRYSDLEMAIAVGLETAIGDFSVIMDIYFDPISLLPELLKISLNGCDVLIGVNNLNSSKVYEIIRNLYISLVHKYVNILITPNATGFEILSRSAINAITSFNDSKRKLRFISDQIGFDSKIFYYDYFGPQKSFNSKLSDAIEIVVRNSSLPLLITSRLSLFISFLNFIYMFYIVIIYTFNKNVVPGWTTTSLQNSTMFFFIFLVLAVLCEYLSKLMSETNTNSKYIILKEISNSDFFKQRNILK